MPPVLVKAHQELDKAVDLCYRPQPSDCLITPSVNKSLSY